VEQYLAQQNLRASSEDSFMQHVEAKISNSMGAQRQRRPNSMDIKEDLASELSQRLLMGDK